MALDQSVERVTQAGDVEPALDPERERNVVGRVARIETLQEHEAALCEREHGRRVRVRFESGRGGTGGARVSNELGETCDGRLREERGE